MPLLPLVFAMSLGSPPQSAAIPPPGSPKTEAATFSARRLTAEALVSQSGAEVAVAYRALDGSEEWMYEADKTFHAASTMKVAVMAELFRQESEKRLKLTDEIEVKNEFKSAIDGSPFALEMGDDSDATVYKNVGKTMSLDELNFQMITVSSNFATNLLIDRLGIKNIRATVDALGAYGLEVRRGVEDQKAFDQGVINETTARGLFLLLGSIARGQAVSKPASARMVEVLQAQAFNDGIPRGVPEGTKVAHKTGTITRVHHDAAIVYGDRPCVLVILTRGIEKESESDALIARITRALLP